MTGTDLNRRKRQMNRRIREVLAVRRSLVADRALEAAAGAPTTPGPAPAAS